MKKKIAISEQHFDTIEVGGISVRTKNVDELDASTAKIAGLWEDFYTTAVTQLNSTSQVYGVYTNYESDANGEFDVIAGSNTIDSSVLTNGKHCQIEAGKYLTFTASGAMPKVVIGIWGHIWEYFNAPDCPHKRKYSSDFEWYKSDVQVTVAIAIE